MTSNVGTRQVKDFGTGVGFSTKKNYKFQLVVGRKVIKCVVLTGVGGGGYRGL
jgi:hypothetical protein